MPRKPKHRFDPATTPAAATPTKPLRYTSIGSPLRLRVYRHARLERPEVAEIDVALVPIEKELAKLSDDERADALREAERVTARDFFLDRKTGELELAGDFLRQFFTIEEGGAQFQYDGTGECRTLRAWYDRLEDV